MTRSDPHSSSHGDAPDDRHRSGEEPRDFDVVATGDPSRGMLVDAWPEVNQATGMIAVQLDASIADAATVLEVEAVSSRRTLESVAEDVLARRMTFPTSRTMTAHDDGQVEAWYAENHRNESLLNQDERIDADRWLYLHLDEVVGASRSAATALIQESGMSAHVIEDWEVDPLPHTLNTGRIRLVIDETGDVQNAQWG